MLKNVNNVKCFLNHAPPFFFEGGGPMVPKSINIINIFNFSQFRAHFLNIHQGELTFLTCLQFRAFFCKKMLETAEVLKVAPFGSPKGVSWFQRVLTLLTFLTFPSFAHLFLNIHQGELTSLTFLHVIFTRRLRKKLSFLQSQCVFEMRFHTRARILGHDFVPQNFAFF